MTVVIIATVLIFTAIMCQSKSC